MTTSLVSPAYFSSEEEEELDVDILSVSVEGTERHSDDSDIEVIACYRHVPIEEPKKTTPRKITTDLSSCVDDRLPEFPWDNLADLWPENSNPLKWTERFETNNQLSYQSVFQSRAVSGHATISTAE